MGRLSGGLTHKTIYSCNLLSFIVGVLSNLQPSLIFVDKGKDLFLGWLYHCPQILEYGGSD